MPANGSYITQFLTRSSSRSQQLVAKAERPPEICWFVRSFRRAYKPWWLTDLFVDDAHLVHVDVVRRCRAVAVKLEGVGELVVGGSGEEGVVCYAHHCADAIHRDRVMKHRVAGGVIVIFRHNVVPCTRSERSKCHTGGLPLLQPVVKRAPHQAAMVLRLPGKVVNPSIQRLLAFKFNGLRCRLHAGRDIQVKLVGQRVDPLRNDWFLAIPVSIRKWHGCGDGKVCSSPAFAWRRHSRREAVWRHWPGSTVVTAGAAREPVRRILNVINYGTRWRTRSRGWRW